MALAHAPMVYRWTRVQLFLASFRLVYPAMLAEAYIVKDMQRPSMVPVGVTWISIGARRAVMVQDADETAGGQMLDLMSGDSYGVRRQLSMCFLGTPPTANYHAPLVAHPVSTLKCRLGLVLQAHPAEGLVFI